MQTDKEKRIEEIIDSLRGSAQSLGDVCTDEEQNDLEVTNAIDLEIFNCTTCGWWCEVGDYCIPCCEESNDGDICSDCCDNEGHNEE